MKTIYRAFPICLLFMLSFLSTLPLAYTACAYEELNRNVEIPAGANGQAGDKQQCNDLLLLAAQGGIRDGVEMYLSQGADVNTCDTYGRTPLHMAASGQHKEIVALLLARKAKVNVKDKAGRTPLHYAVGASHPWWQPKDGDIGAATLLLDNGADIDTPDTIGRTPLHYSVRLGTKMTELLLDRGADANLVDHRGVKPIPPKDGYTYYVATNGDDSGVGSLSDPFKTVNTAIMVARLGDTIYLRAGTYRYAHTVVIDKSGTQDKPMRLLAYPGETPVFDFSRNSGAGLVLRGAHWHLKRIIITDAGTDGLVLQGQGSHHNIVEKVVSHSTGRTGIAVHTAAAQNLILNCDAYQNFDVLGNGENADGIEVKFAVGKGNVLIGNRAWHNADDGYDLWHAGNSVRLESCYAWRNGENLWSYPFFTGNGNGFKLGQLEGAHILTRCVAWDHRCNGIDLNGNSTGVQVSHCTAVRNAVNYAFVFSKGNIEKNILKNNLSFAGRIRIKQKVQQESNSWNPSVGADVTEADFLSLDDTCMTQPRRGDGSIPANDFLKLAPGSGLIDGGTDVNRPFAGQAPDLGAFERRPNNAARSQVHMLHQHVRDHNVERIHTLLAEGTDVNEKDWLGYAPLHWACYFGYRDLTRILLAQGANPHLISDTGRTPTEIAAEMGYRNIAALLCERRENQ